MKIEKVYGRICLIQLGQRHIRDKNWTQLAYMSVLEHNRHA
ncbi:hypothetical protein ADIARSV_0553 [Arcticibacter svalbardensis MN12-7]|uniref:Uncharacterized protein n=1 Tax=Arcticibacter svalbardensis MN12-7 TaxID=1150600 RepID=R9GXC7_9SPHI|nr:hypothetical protein ADIARSV_0553 [Arcticibacter svalbardensis MN12-7]